MLTSRNEHLVSPSVSGWKGIHYVGVRKLKVQMMWSLGMLCKTDSLVISAVNGQSGPKVYRGLLVWLALVHWPKWDLA